MPNQRIVFLDYLRVIACFMVVIVHACEFYYLNEDGIFFARPDDRIWVSIIDSALRESVPLFVMTSSFLLLPLTCSAGAFFKRRFVRILIPFLIWSIFYAIAPVLAGLVEGDIPARLTRLLYNFNGDSGHLWFIYMLIGVYLIMPIISPWLSQVSKRAEQAFLAVWFVTTFWGYLTPWLGDIWGVCFWNDFHALYYYSGYIGYVVLAHYIREHVDWSFRKSLAVSIPLIVIGYAVTAWLFYTRSIESTEPIHGEQSWCFCTFNVAMMTTGWFLLLKHIKYTGAWLYRPIQWISRMSYGIYLMHIFFLGLVYQWLAPMLSTPVAIFSVGTVTFIVCCLVCKVLSYIPGSKYIIG